MDIFGWSIIRTSELREYHEINLKIAIAHRWLSGWKDLDIIWDYIFENKQIEYTRREYAKARGTNEYGVKIPELIKKPSYKKKPS